MSLLPKYILSKSTFLKGLQCEKALYLYKHHYNLKDKITPQQQAIFNQGNAVGELAQEVLMLHRLVISKCRNLYSRPKTS